jgi:hypothetical protein
MKWGEPLVMGKRVNSLSTVSSAEKKGFEKVKLIVFVNSTIRYRSRKTGVRVASIVKERSHVVFLPSGHNKREVREGTPLAFLIPLVC